MDNRLRTLGLVPFTQMQITYQWEHWYHKASGTTLCGFDLAHAGDQKFLLTMLDGVFLLDPISGARKCKLCPDCERARVNWKGSR